MLEQSPLLAAVELRKQQHLHRQRVVTSAVTKSSINIAAVATDAICFCSNDYLGLANHPQVIASMQQAAATYGVGSTASPLISGYKKIHQQFEEEFANFVGMERALLFSSGYLANIGAITAAVGRSDLVYQDKENHASLIDAVILARAKSLRYRDVAGLQQQISQQQISQQQISQQQISQQQATHAAAQQLIITEGVFSMSGRAADLEQLLAVAAQADAWLLVDEAHGMGVVGDTGAGSLADILAKVKDASKHSRVTQLSHGQNSPQQSRQKQSLNIQEGAWRLPREIILTAPLGKAFGCAGGVVAGSSAYIEHCIQQARSYIYSTGIAPALAAANLTSLHILREETWRRRNLAERIQQFKTGSAACGLTVLPSNTPVQYVVIGDEKIALQISEQLLSKKIWVRAMRYPTVSMGKAGLRISITALHHASDINYLLEQLYQLYSGFRC